MNKKYTTSSGITVDMEAIRTRHSREVAAGNMKVNARGDRLGKGGKVVKKAQDVYRAQHSEHSKATVKQVSIKEQLQNPVTPTAPKVSKKKKKEITLDNGDIVVVDAEQNPDPEL